MPLLPSRNSSKYKSARQDVVPAVAESLFQRDERKVDLVGEEVEAEEHSRDVRRQEDMHQVRERVVVCRREGVRGWQSVIPVGMQASEGGGRGV